MSQTEPQSAPLTVNMQYTRDLSFEVPGAPGIFATLRTQPQVAINLDVQARRADETQPLYEVSLMIRAEATEPPAEGAEAGRVVFIAELTYAGLFTLSAIPNEQVEPVLLIECPRILFPFARNIIAEITREGGFPPVLLQPIDFVSLWHSRRAQGGQQQEQVGQA